MRRLRNTTKETFDQCFHQLGFFPKQLLNAIKVLQSISISMGMPLKEVIDKHLLKNHTELI